MTSSQAPHPALEPTQRSAPTHATPNDGKQQDPDPLIPILLNGSVFAAARRSLFLNYTGHNPPPTPFTLHPQTSQTAATHVLTWLSTQPTTSSPLPLPLPAQPITFHEACNLYAVAHALRIRRQLQGDVLRDELWLYLWSSPVLTNDEFAMVLDLCWFDGELLRLAHARMGKSRGELAGMMEYAEGLLRERRKGRERS